MGYSLDRRNNKSDNRFEVNKIIYSVQLINPNKTKKEHNKKLFTGLLRCGGCNHLLTQSSRNYYCRHKTYVDSAECLGERISHQEIVDVVGKL